MENLLLIFENIEIQISLKHISIFKNNFLIAREKVNSEIPREGTYQITNISKSLIYQTGKYVLPSTSGWTILFNYLEPKKFSSSCNIVIIEESKYYVTDLILYFPKTNKCFYEGALCIYNEFRSFENLVSELEIESLRANPQNIQEAIQHV
jgi:hypothetical protein